jgi:hypothetical protein
MDEHAQKCIEEAEVVEVTDVEYELERALENAVN